MATRIMLNAPPPYPLSFYQTPKDFTPQKGDKGVAICKKGKLEEAMSNLWHPPTSEKRYLVPAIRGPSSIHNNIYIYMNAN